MDPEESLWLGKFAEIRGVLPLVGSGTVLGKRVLLEFCSLVENLEGSNPGVMVVGEEEVFLLGRRTRDQGLVPVPPREGVPPA